MVQSVPSGLISVIPQAWITRTPYSSWNFWVTARGQAEPPITTRSRSGRSPPCFSRCCSSISQTVGTAALNVTFSDTSNS